MPLNVSVYDPVYWFAEKRAERRSQCTECKKWFRDLPVHMLTHTGEKKHACGSCSKMFPTASHATRHRLIHSGQRPYKCHLCDKAFNQRGHLNRHIANVHTWGCRDCGQTDFKLHFVLHFNYHDFNWFCLLSIVSALRLLVGWKEGHRACKQLRGGVVLASVKSRLVLPFWYWLTRVVPKKGPLNGCVCVYHSVVDILKNWKILPALCPR